MPWNLRFGCPTYFQMSNHKSGMALTLPPTNMEVVFLQGSVDFQVSWWDGRSLNYLGFSQNADTVPLPASA